MTTDDLLQQLKNLPPAERAALLVQLGDNPSTGSASLKESSTGGSVNTGYIMAGGDFAGRDLVKHIVNLYLQAPGPAQMDEAEFTRAIGRYLDWVARHYGRLDLRGIQTRGRDAPHLTLNDVYVSLSVSLPSKRRGRQSTAETETIVDMDRIFPDQPRLAIIGGAGCGKTTYLKLIASLLARALLTRDTQPVQTWLGVTGDLPLPIFISLGEYNRYRRQSQGNLVAYLSYSLIEKNVVAGLPTDFFSRLLLQGHACCLLLDGLDEVANEQERWQVSEDVTALADNQGIPHLLVTSRSRAYEGRTTLPFRTATVQPMTAEAVAALAARWCRAVYPAAEAEAEAADLQTQIEQLEAHREARQQPPLIETPLLTTLVAIVHYDQRRLPQQRAELYQKCVDVLLAEKHKPGRETFVQLADWGGSEKEKRRLMAELAYQMMDAGADAGRQVAEEQIKAWLQPAATKMGWDDNITQRLDTFLLALRERNSLLDERAGQYDFIHLTFQEYLCAYYLAEIMRDVATIAHFFGENGRVNDPWWRETILLTIGYLGLNGPENALALIAQLVKPTTSPTADTLAAAELAAIAFLELDSQDQKTAVMVRQQLKNCLADSRLAASPLLRMIAGDGLAALGDDRPGVLSLEPDLVAIPAGKFLMGDGRHEILIRQSFALARYPVTNAQYRRFVEDGGYTKRQQACWTAEGWAYREKYDWQQPRYWQNVDRNRDNQPVVGVSWYGAVAFCHWLTGQLRQNGFLRSNQEVRLPTEAEWERAARHTDGRTYPWGDWQESVANSEETRLKRTTAVGIFPANASVAGILDLSGNVLEWCQTRWRDEEGNKYSQPYQPDDGREELAGENSVWRVLRGGSYHNNEGSLRGDYRNWYFPDHWVDVGFRVCVCPFPYTTSDL